LLDDPPAGDDGNGEHWWIAEDDFFRQYYRGIIEYLREFDLRRKQVGNAVFVTAPLFPFLWDFIHYPSPRPFHRLRLELGLLASIYEAPERTPDALRDLPHDDGGEVGSDGIAIFGPMLEWEKA